MTVPFFDSNPEIVNELKAMDHSTKEYKKQLRKVFQEIGGLIYLFNNLKTTDDGKRFRRKYVHHLIATGAFIISMFVWIILAAILIGDKEFDQFNIADIAFFIGFISFEIVSVFFGLFIAFRSNRVLLDGLSYLIDSYKYENSEPTGNTLINYKFVRYKINKFAIIISILSFVVVYGAIMIGSGIIKNLSASSIQEFSKAGMTIALTQDFQEKDIVSQTATYLSSKYIVICLKEDFKILEQNNISSDISLNEYAEIVISSNSIVTNIEGNESRPYFVYSQQISGKDYKYLAIAFKGSDAYWTVTFVCESKNYESSKEQLLKWADTIKIT